MTMNRLEPHLNLVLVDPWLILLMIGPRLVAEMFLTMRIIMVILNLMLVVSAYT